MNSNEMKQQTNKEFETGELGLATFLKMKGMQAVAVKGKREKRRFIYSNSPILQKMIAGWYANEGGYQTFFNCYRNMRSQLINMGKAGE